MPEPIYIPPAREECWFDAKWRTSTLLKVCKDHGLGHSELSELTGVKHNTARHWLTNHQNVIPAPHLRGLLYDLNRKAGL